MPQHKKPTAIRLLEGDRGKGRRPVNTNEPIPPKATVECPFFITGYARDEWIRIAPSLQEMGVLSCIDTTAFAAYCYAHATMRECIEYLNTHDKTYTLPSGQIKTVPEVEMLDQAMTKVKAFAAEFGLTPAARSRINAAATTTKKQEDPMAALLSGNFDVIEGAAK